MRKIILFILLSPYFVDIHAQSFLGYEHSNFAGITGASYNPASLADNALSMEIQGFGIDMHAADNYAAILKRFPFSTDFYEDHYLFRDHPDRKKAGFARTEVLLPAFMISNQKFGWGFDLKIRNYLNVDGMPEAMAHMLLTHLNDPADYGRRVINKHVSVQQCSWVELGGTYAKTIWTGAEHFVSVGIRPKLLLGLSAAYVFINNLDYEALDANTLVINSSDLKFGHSNNYSFTPAFQPVYHYKFDPGLGIDAGIIYENRPDTLQKQEDHRNGKELWPGFRERPVYRYRLGISLTDLGIIRYKSGIFTDEYSAQSPMWILHDKDKNYTAPENYYRNFMLMEPGAGEGKGFWMRTPLALDMFADYHLKKNIYINAQSFTALYFRGTDLHKVHELTRISITPRYESRWFGIWAPLSYTRMGTVSMGTGVRIGYFIIGTTDILNLALKNKKMYNADIYATVKLPMFPEGTRKRRHGTKKKSGNPAACPK